MKIKEIHKVKTRQLIKDGKSLEAVKYLQNNLNLNLKTAMRLVQAMSDDKKPASVKAITQMQTSGASKVFILIPAIFCVIGLIMAGVAAYIFLSQKSVIDQGNMVEAQVVATPSSPLFRYEFEGEEYEFQSSTSSSPPSYFIGETVDFYVNENNPYDGIIDTFTDRWLLIVIFGGMGSMFVGTSLLVGFIFKRVNAAKSRVGLIP